MEKVSYNLLGSDHLAGGIIGVDFMAQHKGTWDIAEGRLRLNDDFIVSVKQRPVHTYCNRLETEKPLLLQPRSEVIIPARKVIENLGGVSLVTTKWTQ